MIDKTDKTDETKVAIVTGGNKGVGRGIVYSLLNAGFNVCICYNSSKDFAFETLKKADQIADGHAFLHKCDVSVRDSAKAMVEETVRRFGKIDLLVNNAALQPNLPVGMYDMETFKRIWDINIGGYFLCLQEALPHLKQSKCPRVINIASIHAKRPSVFDAGYSMTKSAIKMFTREAAIELAKYKITVNYITLGGCKIEGKTASPEIHFGAFDLRMPEGAKTKTMFPLGRITTPKDVGELIVYLASEKSGIITGTGIRVDGGSALL
ncbi:MAG: SDR family oxidoreductase [Oscillospiraceae bacterium]|nr:SDR family oxidoreductase [Oscillospiraceae bacterium]